MAERSRPHLDVLDESLRHIALYVFAVKYDAFIQPETQLLEQVRPGGGWWEDEEYICAD